MCITLRHFLLLPIALMGMHGLRAQSASFQHTYTAEADAQAYAVRQVAGGGYLLAGKTRCSNDTLQSDAYLVRTDYKGDVVWARSFGAPGTNDGPFGSGVGVELFHAIDETADGGFIATGSTNTDVGTEQAMLCVRTNAMGDTLWTRAYNTGGGCTGKDVLVTGDGDLVFFGDQLLPASPNLGLFLIKTDANGDTLWTRGYATANPLFAVSILPTGDNGYLLLGKDNGGNMGFLLKTDASGNQQWSKTYYADSVFFIPAALLPAGGNQYYLTGSTGPGGNMFPCLSKVDETGGIIWSRSYHAPGLHNIHAGTVTEGTELVLCGSSLNSPGAESGLMMKTDSTGALLSATAFGGAYNERFMDVVVTTDGGLALCGYRERDTTGLNMYLVKTDGDGLSGCDESADTFATQFITVNTVTNPVNETRGAWIYNTTSNVTSGSIDWSICLTVDVDHPFENNSPEVFPNPLGETLHIRFPEALMHQQVLVSICTLSGQIVSESWMKAEADVLLSCEDLRPGVYLYSIRSGASVWRGKLVALH